MNSRFIDIYRVFQRHPEGTQPKFVLRALNADRMENCCLLSIVLHEIPDHDGDDDDAGYSGDGIGYGGRQDIQKTRHSSNG